METSTTGGSSRSTLRYAKPLILTVLVAICCSAPEILLSQELSWQALSIRSTERYDKASYREAKQLGEQALEIGQNTFGLEHPNVAISLNDLALVSLQLGDYSKADSLFTRALEIRERARGVDHVISANICDE